MRIPKNLTQDKVLRIKEKGNLGMDEGPRGDIFIKVNFENKKKFKYDGLDVIKVIEISVIEAVLGLNVTVDDE